MPAVRLSVVLALIGLAGCSEPVLTLDAGGLPPPDASIGSPDAGSVEPPDAGGYLDAGAAVDSGPVDAEALDASDGIDAGGGADAETAWDASGGIDAGGGADAETALDASGGIDAGGGADAETALDASSGIDVGVGVDTGVPGTGRVEGLVTEAMTGGQGLAGATVEAEGRTAVTGAAGEFVLTGLPTGLPLQVRVRGPAGSVHSTTQREVVAPPTGAAFVTLELLRGCSATLNVAASAGTLAPRGCGHTDSRVGLVLPQGGVVDASGAAASDVLVELAVLPVALSGQTASDALRAFPGDMRARSISGASTFLESRGAVEVRLSDPSTGAPLRLAPGHTAVLTFSASEASFDEPSVPAWFFDEQQGRWVEEGATTLAIDPVTGAPLHRLEVSHFTTWNADQPALTTCLTGRLLAAPGGAGLPATSVGTFGVDYLGHSNTLSAPDGRFTVPARRSSEAVLVASARAGGVLVERRLHVRTNPDASCADVGDVVVDTAPLFACAAGRVLDEQGQPVAGIDVTAFSHSGTSAAVTSASGAFCVPVPPQERFDVSLAGLLNGVPARAHVGGLLAAAGSGTCGGAGCTLLGDLTVRALTCITGRVLDAVGTVPGARVMASGPANLASALTSATGQYCLPLQRDGEVDLTAYTFAPLRIASSPRRSAPSPAAACGSAACLTVDLVLADSACVRGVATSATGVPLEGITVRAVPVGGGHIRSVTTESNGTFCAPLAAGLDAELEFSGSRPGTRLFATQSATAPAGPASCGGSGCTDVGAVALASLSFAGCVKGRLRDGPGVFRDRVDVLSAANRLAIFRPREDGTYCFDLPVTPVVTLRDPEDRGCARPRAFDLDLAALAAGSCSDERTCLEGGDVDFANFCATS